MSEPTWNSYVQKVTPHITALADKAVQDVVSVAKEQENGVVLCCDGGWSSRRQARECSVYATYGRKIIGRCHVMKTSVSEKVLTV